MLQHRTGDDFHSVAVVRDYLSSPIHLKAEHHRHNQNLKVFIAAWKLELTKIESFRYFTGFLRPETDEADEGSAGEKSKALLL